jgi:LmbE family N-acetylglucosaminyl deacetylase
MNILGIFAHPDDESFGPAGTLAQAAVNDHRVGIVTLTRGEAGSLGISKELDRDELTERRTKELQCAAEVLGVTYLRIYSLPDNKLSTLPEKKILKILVNEIHQFAPDVVITFHRNGISGHPDHKTVTKLVNLVVRQSNKSPILLEYGLVQKQTEMITNRKLYAMNNDEVTHEIDVSALLSKKIESILCHKTQEELWLKFKNLGDQLMIYLQWDYFAQVYPEFKLKGNKSKIFE